MSPRIKVMAMVACCLVGCTEFAPRSSREETSGAGGSATITMQTPPVIQPSPTAPADLYAASKSHLFVTNEETNFVSVFSPIPLTASDSFERNAVMPSGPRLLFTSPLREFAVVLTPSQSWLCLVCQDDNTPVTGVTADSAVIVAAPSTKETRIVAFNEERADGSASGGVSGGGNGGGAGSGGLACPQSTLSVVTTDDCRVRTVETVCVPPGPHEAQVSRTNPWVYFTSADGVGVIDLSKHPSLLTPLVRAPLRDMRVATVGGKDYLLGHSNDDIQVIDVTAKTSASLADFGGSTAAGGAAGTGGAADDAGADGAVGGGPSAEKPSALSKFSLAPSEDFLLVAGTRTLTRYALPLGAVPARTIDAPGDITALGVGNDCAIAYSTGSNVLAKVGLDPLTVTPIALGRDIETATLYCRPGGDGAKPDCCAGVAVVLHPSDPLAPIGQTEAYTVVDLRTLRADSNVSSFSVRAQTAFDDGNGVLIALSNEASRNNAFRILSPFASDAPGNAITSLSDQPLTAGSLSAGPSVAFIGLGRPDGSVTFVGRQLGTVMGVSAGLGAPSYQSFGSTDFRLPDRVHRLAGENLP